MGRKRQKCVLDVYVGSTKVGQYSRAPSGATAFRYVPDWLSSERAFPISLSMPLSDRIWSGEGVASYFDGLLPDDRTVREKIAAREHAESASVFDLLAVIGRDCVGALRFVPEDQDPGDPTKMEYRPVSDDEIAARLASLGTNPLGIRAGEDDFRISIAGVQEKTAFLRVDNQWQLPLGPTPTSHIFKPAMKEGPNGVDFSETPWNEWFCLALCRALRLETTNAEVLLFDGKPVIVVERFDRTWREGVLYRLPQEDICQALGAPPARKYQSDAGPGIIDVLEFLNGAAVPHEDRLIFMKAQIVFWLLAAIDGHAKNFSLFITPGGYRLTPLYDVMSASPYPEFPVQKVKLAMAVGNKNYYRLKQIQRRHFYQTGQKAGLREQEMDGIFSDLAAQIEDAINEVAALAADASMPESTSAPILAGVSKRAGLIGVRK
ncbi:MAG: type II toxin-antitoxin system HipA family toxin [Candidatus Thiodiazotropha sp. (ex Dulcina madagascariensis)]|nr:type II toxin-antitoxin system HipA family toxin [Candidatus Thiodiazotropha sp. (ex Dulcina madagascariensis)]